MDALTDVTVPDIGDFADVPVIEVLVAAGDVIAAEDPLVVIESDKATMEIPSPAGGVVRELLLAVGDKVSQGTPILRLEAIGGAAPEEPGAVGRADELGELGRAEEPNAVRAPSENHDRSPLAATGEPARATPRTAGVYAGPAVRRRARERGIDLTAIRGTGRRGRITLDDLERELTTPSRPGAQGDSLGLAPWPEVDFAKFGPVERVPLSRIQKISGANLARNWVRIPHVTHNEQSDITELESFRRQLNAEQSEVKVTMVALLLKIVPSVLAAFPQFNASLDGDELVLKRHYHLGFAVDTPNGLVVAVVRDVDRKGLIEIARELAELSAKARAGRLAPSEMAGGTFTISSLGGIGGTSFTPIINAPEVAILGVVRARTQPVWDGEEFRARLMLGLSLSYDHRVIDGASAARFCAQLARSLTDMRRVLL